MPLRFLRYITEFYQSFHGNTTSGLLPAVFPLLLYNGEAKWRVPDNSEEMIIEEDIEVVREFVRFFNNFLRTTMEEEDDEELIEPLSKCGCKVIAKITIGYSLSI